MQDHSQPIIDFHVHIFPEKVAEKAVQSIAGYYNLPMRGSGTVEGLLESGEPFQVKRYVVHGTATRPDQVRAINDFLAEACRRDSRLVGFGSLHPNMEDLQGEFERIQALGLRGIKLHPDFQDFSIDDEAAMAIYALAEGRLPVMLHMGDENRDSSSPQRLAAVLDRFPKLVLIAAHLGGYRMWDESLRLLVGRNIYFDTSSSLEFLEPEKALEIIRKHGADRVLFGTDYPMWMHEDEMERFNRLGLNSEERELILYRNAARLLGL
jgi:uncharacterized protein